MTPLERLHALHDRTGHGLDDCTDVLFVDVRERIKQLEAELASFRPGQYGYQALVARVQRAEERMTRDEKELARMDELRNALAYAKARAEKAEEALDRARRTLETSQARVAELETQLRSTVSCNHHEMPERWYSGQLDVTQERLHAQDEEREAD